MSIRAGFLALPLVVFSLLASSMALSDDTKENQDQTKLHEAKPRTAKTGAEANRAARRLQRENGKHQPAAERHELKLIRDEEREQRKAAWKEQHQARKDAAEDARERRQMEKEAERKVERGAERAAEPELEEEAKAHKNSKKQGR